MVNLPLQGSGFTWSVAGEIPVTLRVGLDALLPTGGDGVFFSFTSSPLPDERNENERRKKLQNAIERKDGPGYRNPGG